jgi:hydroxyethylthiazole kinase-like uncharacterized protein yjeF
MSPMQKIGALLASVVTEKLIISILHGRITQQDKEVLAMKVSTVQQMHSLDRRAIEEYAIPGYILMENAGEAAYYVILNEFGVKGKKFVVFCGSGHNGGDGLVVARKLNSTGGEVTVLCLSSPEKFDGTVSFHYEMVKRAQIPFVLLDDENVDELSLKYILKVK